MGSMITEDYERVVSLSWIMSRGIRASSTQWRDRTSDIQDDLTASNAKQGAREIYCDVKILSLLKLSGIRSSEIKAVTYRSSKEYHQESK